MNQNPWFIEQMAKYERQQIAADMKQIRLAERALRADNGSAAQAPGRPSHARMFRRVALVLTKAIIAMIG